MQAHNMGVRNWCVGPCIDFWSDHFVLNTDAMELLVLPMQGDCTLLLSYSKKKNPALQANLEPYQRLLGVGQIWLASSVKVLSC